MKVINRTNKIYMNEMINETRAYLMVIERKNIEIRRKYFELLINEETVTFNKRVFHNDHIKVNNLNNFKYDVNDIKMKENLNYIYKWKGLTSSASTSKTIKDYQNKSRNWLNGRRTKEYGNTLFIDMINNAIQV